MKAQKLGLVLGMNMAVACLVFQGCKVKPVNMPPPSVDQTVTVDGGQTATAAPETTTATPAPQAASTQSTTAPAIEISTTEPEPAPQPSQVRDVKPLPAAKARPAATAADSSASATTAESAGAPATVVVQRGDTLSAICVRNHVKMSAVLAANPGLKPNRILVGQKIVIPGAAVATAAAPKEKSAKVMNASAPVAASTTAPSKTKSSFKSYNGPTKEYKVRSGDMMGKIAYANGITVRALKEMNKLTVDTLKVGQVILIPAEKVVEAKAEKPVAKADKKAVKAPEAKKDAAAPVQDAAVVQPPVKVAEPVQAPAAAPAVSEAAPAATTVDAAAAAPAAAVSETAAAPEATASADAAPASSLTYTAKDGDDIVGVAIAWGISPSQLMDLNNLKAGEAITPGQVLKLPANAKQSAQ